MKQSVKFLIGFWQVHADVQEWKAQVEMKLKYTSAIQACELNRFWSSERLARKKGELHLLGMLDENADSWAGQRAGC